jgi:hypothetical protein
MHVKLDRRLGNEQRRTDIAIGFAARQQFQNLRLALAERNGWQFRPARALGHVVHQLGGNRGLDRRAAFVDVAHSADDLFLRAALEQVAVNAELRRLDDVILLVVRRVNDNLELWCDFADLPQCVHARCVAEFEIEQHDVGRKSCKDVFNAVEALDIADDVDIRLRIQYVFDAEANHRMVVDDQNAYRRCRRVRHMGFPSCCRVDARQVGDACQ